MDSAKRIEVAIRAAQTAKSVLELLNCKDRIVAGLMFKQIVSDLEGLRQAVSQAWPK